MGFVSTLESIVAVNLLFDSVTLCSLFHMTLRTIFLTAIASARRVFELCILSAKAILINSSRHVLRPMPSFLPKVSTYFHLNYEAVFPAFPIWVGGQVEETESGSVTVGLSR